MVETIEHIVLDGWLFVQKALAVATSILANEQNVHDELNGQKNYSWLESDFVAKHSGKLKQVQNWQKSLANEQYYRYNRK